jgi:hypothetical protein
MTTTLVQMVSSGYPETGKPTQPSEAGGAKYLLLIVIAAEKSEKQNADDNAEDDGHRPLPNV